MEQYGGFWRRVGAYIIDIIIMAVAMGVIGSIIGLNMGYNAAYDLETGAAAGGGMANIISLAIGIAYFAGMESSSMQATLGKKALGMVVTDTAGNRISFARALGRYFAKILSAIILCIGFIMVAFTDKKQGLHDMIAGTLVHVGNPQGNAVAAFE